MGSDVRRIRLELTTFDIEGPFTPALDGAAGATAAGATADTGTAIGQCRGDQFVAATGLGSSPIICGTNAGQHMILDTDGTMCVKAMFTFSTSGNVQRSYRIHNVQFGGNNDTGGPAGCLQYYTGEMGTVNSFNWNGVAAGVHLANQDYDVCVRQRADACRICWAPITTGTFGGAIAQGSFGVSNGISGAAAPKSGTGVNCDAAANAKSNDFVTIGAAGVAGALGQANSNEASAGAAVNDSPLGVFGFSLGFRQMACA